MSATTRRWQVNPRLPAELDQALTPIGPPILRQLLFNRGVSSEREAAAFLSARPPGITDPLALSGMRAAGERLWTAVSTGERIVIYGDYDTDGVTATALLVEAVRSLGGEAEHYIPNRFDEGYGLNVEALQTIKTEKAARLVVTVDCGIRSLDEAHYARRIELDLIITDHHHPGPELPLAVAVINPKQPGDEYPHKELAGVGLAYKLAQGLFSRAEAAGKRATIPVESLLDFAALGTVADLAPLTGENRFLVSEGLKLLNRSGRAGVVSLLAVSSIKPGAVNATAIGFSLGPRLNAAGRLESALAAYELLTTRDRPRAEELAALLENQNRERQDITRTMQQQARAIAVAGPEIPFLLFAADPQFNRGVVGLAASRLVEEFYRPAVVAQIGAEETRGSARSIREFHITEAFDECGDLLVRHGGHAAAAGFTVRNENLNALAGKLQALAKEQLSGLDLRPSLSIDAVMKFSSLDWALLEHLKQMEPCGYGNPTPILAVRNVKVFSSRPVGRDGGHLKFTLSDGRASMDAIGFRMGEWARKMPERVDVAFTFEVNEYNGQKNLQLNIRDLKPAGTPDV